MGLPPKDVEDIMNIDDPKAREVLENTFLDIDPPPKWEMCAAYHVKGDIDDMFWCHLCGIRIHHKCLDKDADLANDIRFEE